MTPSTLVAVASNQQRDVERRKVRTAYAGDSPCAACGANVAKAGCRAGFSGSGRTRFGVPAAPDLNVLLLGLLVVKARNGHIVFRTV